MSRKTAPPHIELRFIRKTQRGVSLIATMTTGQKVQPAMNSPRKNISNLTYQINIEIIIMTMTAPIIIIRRKRLKNTNDFDQILLCFFV